MARRRGVQTEVLVSLAVVMVTATGLLAAFFFKTHAAQVDRLRAFVGRALIEEARSPSFAVTRGHDGAQWWIVSAGGAARPREDGGSAIDERTLELALSAATSGTPLVQTAAPWDPIRFATRFGSGGMVAAARLPPAVSPWAVLALLLADGIVFLALGSFLLRLRVVEPLRQLAYAVEAVGEGGLDARVPEEGVGEVVDLSRAFNQMSEALERRTGALEKAVGELRDTNQSLRQARDGLDRAERLAAVGTMAAGVAHEVGNPMGALLAFLDLAKREGGLSDAGQGHLTRAAQQGERVRTILRQLLDFSRPPRVERGPVSLEQVAEQTAGLIRAQRRYAGIEIRVEADPATPPAWADESMVAQILLNLVLNAAEVLRAKAGESGAIEIRISPGILAARAGEEQGEGGAASDRSRADAAACIVSDDGPGVPRSDRERIFDPFFTTRPPGEGTGLGLANGLRLAQELGGVLELLSDSALGGAAFSLRLPADATSDSDARVRVS